MSFFVLFSVKKTGFAWNCSQTWFVLLLDGAVCSLFGIFLLLNARETKVIWFQGNSCCRWHILALIIALTRGLNKACSSLASWSLITPGAEDATLHPKDSWFISQTHIKVILVKNKSGILKGIILWGAVCVCVCVSVCPQIFYILNTKILIVLAKQKRFQSLS